MKILTLVLLLFNAFLIWLCTNKIFLNKCSMQCIDARISSVGSFLAIQNYVDLHKNNIQHEELSSVIKIIANDHIDRFFSEKDMQELHIKLCNNKRKSNNITYQELEDLIQEARSRFLAE